MGEVYGDITAIRYEYFTVDPGTFKVDVLTPFWRAVTFLGNGGWFWIVLCVLLICFGKTRKTGVTAALSLLSGFLITNLLIKNAVARPRPFDTYTQIIPLITRPKDYSFPSGHTCASFAVALVCLRMLPGKWGILPVVLAGMIAFSRLYLAYIIRGMFWQDFWWHCSQVQWHAG